jgi:hypothetical protein
MKFEIYQVNNGFLLNIYNGKKQGSYIYKEEERIRMFAYIDLLIDRNNKKEKEEDKEDESEQ